MFSINALLEHVFQSTTCTHVYSRFSFLLSLSLLRTSSHSERKIIDIENRSHYQALRERWEVLDKTVFLPDDDLVEAPPYMALSDGENEGEEACVSFLTSEHRIKNTPALSVSVAKHGSIPGPGMDVDKSCSTAKDDGIKSEPSECDLHAELHVALCEKSLSLNAGTGKYLLPENSITAPSVELNSGQTGFAGCCAGDLHCSTSTTDSDLDPRAPVSNGLVGSGAGGDSSDTGERGERCSCDFRRRSYNEVLDDSGRSLLGILELPSRVFATQQPVDLEKSYPKAKRVILRDVLRTDRKYHYFS